MDKILKKRKKTAWFGITIVIAIGLIYLSGPKNAEAQTQTQQIRDIAIEGLDYNTEVYLGSEVAFEAYIKDEPSFEQIRWATNQVGVIELSGQGKQATLKTLQPGQVEIAACVDDDSWSCIHRNIMVRDYPSDSYSQQWLIPGMRAIKQVGINQKNLYVEVAPGQMSEQQQFVLKQYLQQLASLGNVMLQTTSQFQARYKFFTFMVANRAETVTIRVDRNRAGFQQQEIILDNYSAYLEPSVPPSDSGTTDVQPEENEPSDSPQQQEPVLPEATAPQNSKPNQELGMNTEGEKEPTPVFPGLTLDFSEIIHLPDGEQDGTQRYPFRIRFREQLPLNQQQQLLNEYVAKWAENGEITLSSQQQVGGQIVYLFKIFEKTSEKTFYLEFIVDYESGESLPVISPLHLPSEGETQPVVVTTSEKISETITPEKPQEDEQHPALTAMLLAQILGGMYLWRWYHQRQSTVHSGEKGGCEDVNHRTM